MTTCSTYKTSVALPPSFSAVYNYFKEDSEYKLKLTVGDAVHLLCECEEWYFGSTIENRHVCGIFPKSYVHVRECVVDDTGPVPVFILKQPPIVQEITTVLREWGTHWKNLYVVSKSIKCMIFRQIVSKYIEKFAFAFPKLISTFKKIRTTFTTKFQECQGQEGYAHFHPITDQYLLPFKKLKRKRSKSFGH